MSASERERRLSPSSVRPSSILSSRRLSRRAALQWGLGTLVAIPLATACGQSAPVAPTSAPAAPPKPAEAANPGAPAAAPAASGRAEPKAPAFNKAKVNGKLSVVQSRDFHPDHNTLVEQKIKEFASQMDYPLDHSWAEAYAGAGNVVAKLTASVQAGDAPDVLIHTLRPSELKFLDLIEDVDD